MQLCGRLKWDSEMDEDDVLQAKRQFDPDGALRALIYHPPEDDDEVEEPWGESKVEAAVEALTTLRNDLGKRDFFGEPDYDTIIKAFQRASCG